MTNHYTNNERRDARVINSLVNTPRRPGSHYKLAPTGRSLAIEFSGQPYVDRKAMSARAVISTATIDRVGDLLIPRGCHLENYSKNPVVMWAHGLEGIGQPIGTSRDANGQVAVTVSDDDVQATSWFSQTSLEAAQIFELIDEGIVRATSVRETPIKSRLRHDPTQGDVLIVEEWDLEEWSWCAIGVNPDAVAKTLHRNRLGGQPITPSIMKSLTAVATPVKRFGIGISTEKLMSDTTQPADEDDPDTVVDDSSVDSDGNDDGTGNQPYGSTVVSAIHASLTAACHNIEDAMGPLENPAVKDALSEILSSLQEQLAALEGIHSSNYPDQPALKADEEDGDQGDDAMKAFLASGRIASLQVLGLGSRLKGMVGARNLTADQRRTLNGIARQMARLVSQSKSHQADIDNTKLAMLEKSIHELAGLVGSIKK
ncbi:MAG: hypothetical protein WCH39_04055 [Schlesneria sp.]